MNTIGITTEKLSCMQRWADFDLPDQIALPISLIRKKSGIGSIQNSESEELKKTLPSLRMTLFLKIFFELFSNDKNVNKHLFSRL